MFSYRDQMQFVSLQFSAIIKMQTEEQKGFHGLKKSDSRDHEAIIDTCIMEIIKEENYINYHVIKKPINTNGGNYLGSLYEVDVKEETAEGPKATPIFIKTLGPDHIEMEILSLDEVYKRENFVYLKLSQIFFELEDEAQVPVEERYKMPKAYTVPLSNTLFLENLTRRGFQTRYRMDIVTLDFAEESLKELAKFHALSFVLKYKRPDYFNKIIKTFKSPLIFEKWTWTEYVENFLNISLDHLNTQDRFKIEDQLRNIVERFPKYVSGIDEISCLCHGDYRPNNLLVKEVDGRVTEVVPVDYQILFYGCPVLDIIYFIFMSTDLEFRQNHLQHLKEHYYDSLKDFLALFKMPVDTVFSRKQFERLFAEKSDFGLMVTVLFGPLQFASEDNVPDVQRLTMSEWNIELDHRFRDRFDDAVKEFLLI